jgi:hypothetical protein
VHGSLQQLRRRLRAQGGATGLVTRLAGLQKKEETIQKVRARARVRVRLGLGLGLALTLTLTLSLSLTLTLTLTKSIANLREGIEAMSQRVLQADLSAFASVREGASRTSL